MERVSLLLLINLFFITFPGFSYEYSVPERTPGNIIIASYNIKWFGQPGHDIKKLAGVIQYFDICGILEVKDARELPVLVSELEELTGFGWRYASGFRTKRPQGRYYESFSVVWRADRAEMGNGYISNIVDSSETYRHDPFAVSFHSNGFDFMLLFVHTRWTDDEYGTLKGEVAGLPDVIEKIKQTTDERDIIVMGDFNLSGAGDEMVSMADELSYVQIDPNLATTFSDKLPEYKSPYDHIYISPGFTVEYLDNQSGVIDVTGLIYSEVTMETMKKAKKELSDHLPVWAVFSTSYADDD